MYRRRVQKPSLSNPWIVVAVWLYISKLFPADSVFCMNPKLICNSVHTDHTDQYYNVHAENYTRLWLGNEI